MNFFELGEVAKPQGIKGEIKVRLFFANSNKINDHNEVYIGDEKFSLRNVRISSGFAYLTLEGIDSRDSAERLRGEILRVERTETDDLPDGEYYVCDLLGCEVFSTDNKKLGVLEDISQYGAADIYSVKGEQNFSFPALKRVLEKIDIENKKIFINSEALSEVAIYEN